MASLIHFTGHGFVAGDAIYFANLEPSDCGIEEGRTYYVLASNLTLDDFEFSETDGGAAFSFEFDITDGFVGKIATYSPVPGSDPMAPPDPVATPTAPTLTSAVVSGIVRLRVELNDVAEAKLREWEVQITHKFVGGDPDWNTPQTVTLPAGATECSIPALGSTVYAVRVRAVDVYGNYSDYCDPETITTEAGADALSAALADLANDVPDGIIDATKISDNAIETRHISANSVTADALAATLVLASLLYAGDPDGRHVEIDDQGIRLVDTDGSTIVNIPTDANQPVYFKGEVVAESFSSQEQNELSGTIAVTGDAVVTLANGVAAPSVAPTVAASVDSLTLTSTPTGSPKGLAYDSGGSFWIAMDPSSGYVAAEYDATTGALIRRIEATGSTSTVTTTLGSTSHISDSAVATTDNSESQFATLLTMPRDGRITKVSVYMTGFSVDGSVRLCVWSSGGTLLGRSAIYNLNAEALGAGNSNQFNKAMISPISVSAGQNLKVGAMLVSDSDGWQWDRDDGSGKITYLGSGEGLDDFTVTSTDTTRKPNVYITYEYDVDTRLETAPMIGVATDGTYVYTLDSTGVVWKYLRSTGAYVAKSGVQTAITGTKTQAGMFYDATADELILTTTTGTGAGVRIKAVRVVPSTLAVSSTVYTDAAGPTFSGTTDTFRGGARVNDPLNGSAATYWIATTSKVYAFTFSGTALTNTANRDFGQATTVGDGLTHDGTQFRGFDAATPTKIWKFSNWDWTTESAIYWFCYAWYDSAGTTHETAVGPRSSLTLRRRERVQVQNPGIPTGGADDPDKVRIYIKPNATDPGAGNFKLQVTDALTSRFLTDYNSAGAADGGGTPFPSGSPASIQSSGTGWTLKGNGAINRTGTAFPGSPATDDHFWRSDLGMEFFYDGTRWLSTTLYMMQMPIWSASGTYTVTISATQAAAQNGNPNMNVGTDIWIEDITVTPFIAAGTALSASHKWVITLRKLDTSNTATIIATLSLDSGASNVWRILTGSVNDLLGTLATYPALRLDYTKTGTPGNLTLTSPAVMTYRIVAT